MFWPHHVACVVIPQRMTEPMPAAVEAWSPNHWTIREFPAMTLYAYLFLVALGFHCCVRFSIIAASEGYSLVAVCRLLLAAGSPVVEHRLEGSWASVILAHGVSCSQACGIFLDQGLNSCPLHWQVDS